jgi:enterochelin esterase family protein
MPSVRHSLPTTHCSLPTVHCLLLLLSFWTLLLLSACEGFQNPLAAPTLTPPPPTFTPEPTFTPTPSPNTAVGFDDFLALTQAESASARQGLANRFLAQLESAPITTGSRAIFIYQGAATQVQLNGDMNNWNLDEALSMTRLEGTDMWYLTAEFEPNARLDYKYVLNGADFRLDPLNPNTVRGGFGPNSELAMPNYQPPPELLPTAEEIPAGTITSHTINSSFLNQTRTFYVYQPPGQLVGEKLPSVYFQDGTDFLNIIDAPALLDRLIAGRQVPPLIAVFMLPIIRDEDYTLNEAYADFMAEELAPFIQANFDADPAPDKTAVLGPSLAGLAAVHTAVLHPEVFGLAAGQSGAYSVNDGALLRRIAGQGAPGVRFYLVVGSYETAVSGSADVGNLLEANRQLADILEDKGYPYLYEELPQGHSWGLWEATIGRALEYLLA